jgi:hypothetical protein
VRRIPSTSLVRGTGDRLTRARFALPAVISSSIVSSRPSLTTAVRTIARWQPCRISGASVATRCEPSVAA